MIFILQLSSLLLSTISTPNSTALVKATTIKGRLEGSQTAWLRRAGLVRSSISKLWGDENHLDVLSHFTSRLHLTSGFSRIELSLRIYPFGKHKLHKWTLSLGNVVKSGNPEPSSTSSARRRCSQRLCVQGVSPDVRLPPLCPGTSLLPLTLFFFLNSDLCRISKWLHQAGKINLMEIYRTCHRKVIKFSLTIYIKMCFPL